MEPLWGWLAAYVVGLAILQLVLYRYLVDGSESLNEPPKLSDDGREMDVEGGDASREVRLDPFAPRADVSRWSADGERRLCPHCGAENEPESAFTRCRNCAGQL